MHAASGVVDWWQRSSVRGSVKSGIVFADLRLLLCFYAESILYFSFIKNQIQSEILRPSGESAPTNAIGVSQFSSSFQVKIRDFSI
ncbi:unnamed protein product [Citrullus colocynthis]|uniref:Uncharacterized protein n=1 Tax=Citrullus colocynthis TaxID=252529 RepID=A0ABP0Y361_9ROSI